MCISHHMRGKATERLKQLHQQEMAVTMVCAADVETTMYMLIFGTQRRAHGFLFLLPLLTCCRAPAIIRFFGPQLRKTLSFVCLLAANSKRQLKQQLSSTAAAAQHQFKGHNSELH